MLARLTTTWIAALSVSLAVASDLPVRYTVDDKALKGAVAGTNLTFQLFTDAACATTAVHAQVVAIENVNVVSRLKRFKAPGAPTAPPKTAEMSQTLTGVSGSGNLYLKVTGTGVTPVGGACQPQASFVQSSSGSSVTIKDANGNLVGTAATSPFGGSSGFLVRVGGRLTFTDGTLSLGFADSNDLVGLYYASTDCTGPLLALADPDSVIGPTTYRNSTNALRVLYAQPTTGTPTLLQSQLRAGPFWTPSACMTYGAAVIAPDECCQPVTFTADAAPVVSQDLSNLTVPFHAE